MTAPRSTRDLHVPLVVPAEPVGADVYPMAAPSYADLPYAPAAYHAQDRSADRRRKAPLAWLPWALAGALLALVLLAILVGRAADGADPSATGSTTASTGNASVTAAGTDLLAAPQALRAHVGQQARGSAVHVQSVVSDEGFWVGSSTADRVFVHLARTSRLGQDESPYQVRAGDDVDLAGTVQALTATTVRSLGVTDAEGAAQLESTGVFIEARSVVLS